MAKVTKDFLVTQEEMFWYHGPPGSARVRPGAEEGIWSSLGSLSNNDGKGYENVT